jgi:hypothetical protein
MRMAKKNKRGCFIFFYVSFLSIRSVVCVYVWKNVVEGYFFFLFLFPVPLFILNEKKKKISGYFIFTHYMARWAQRALHREL